MNRATFDDDTDLWWAALFVVVLVLAVAILGSLWLVSWPIRTIARALRQPCQ